MVDEKNYKEVLDYIESYWDDLTFEQSQDEEAHIGLPHPYVSPSRKIFGHDQFYWDSYFTILGLLESGRVDLSRGMVDNLVFLYKRFGIIPLRNRFYDLGVSQPPFLTSMALEVYKKDKNDKWLRKIARVAEDELETYWMDEFGDKTGKHLVHDGLSRYCDHFVTHGTAEHESGWDMTYRFDNRCLNFLPVDLNSLLYKYEKDLSYIHNLFGNKTKSEEFSSMAKKRRKKINEYMWDDNKGFFFDYDYENGEISDFYSLAGFYPLWAGIATKEQAREALRNLDRFETEWGLANTQECRPNDERKQWDYPNGWPNQHWIVVKSLLGYDFEDEAERITKKWLDLNKKVFDETGKLWEAYDVVEGTKDKKGRYPSQPGFGWTNAAFLKLVKEFS